MNDDVTASRLRISRRRALALGGSVGLGALIAACTAQGPDGSATPATSGTSAGVPTSGSGGSVTGSSTPSSVAVSTTVPVSSLAGSGSASVQTSTVTSPEILALLDSASTCTLTPAETEGPYYIDVDAIRSDVREDRPGAELTLAVRVQDSSCAALPGAVVEIWHCDAGGVYSGFESASLGAGGLGGQPGGAPGGAGGSGGGSGGGGGPGGGSGGGGGGGSATVSDDGTYLRGAQVTNGDGVVQFVSIYPGWYRGRTVHIHFKVHLDEKTLLTSQLYFDDAMSDDLFAATDPYAAHSGSRTTNGDDGIFDSSLIVSATQAGGAYMAVKNVLVSG